MTPHILRARTLHPIHTPPIDNGAITIHKNHITAIGTYPQIRKTNPQHHTTDLGETILLPGLINTHTHLDYTHLANQIPPPTTNFTQWLQTITQHKKNTTTQQHHNAWTTGAHMNHRHGATTLINIETQPQHLHKLWQTTPLRIHSCIELINIHNPTPPQQILQTTQQQIQQLQNTHHPHNQCGLAPHTPYTTTPQLLQQTAALAKKHNYLLTIHIAESTDETQMLLHHNGTLHNWLQPKHNPPKNTPLQHLLNHTHPNQPILITHANHLTPTDQQHITQTNTTITHCPTTHQYFNRPPFPWQKLQKQNINLTLGTDSLASHPHNHTHPPQHNLLHQMQTLLNQPNPPTPTQILHAVTINPARALNQKLGALAPGYLADLITIPHNGPLRNTQQTILNHNAPTTHTYINGKPTPPPPPPT